MSIDATWTCRKCGASVAGPYSACGSCADRPRRDRDPHKKSAAVQFLSAEVADARIGRLLLALRNAGDVAFDTATYYAYPKETLAETQQIYGQNCDRLMAEWCRDNGEPEIAKLFQPDARND